MMPRLLWLCSLVVTVVLVEVRGQDHTCTMTCGNTPTYFNSTFEDTDEFWEDLHYELEDEFCAGGQGPFRSDPRRRNCKCWRSKQTYLDLLRYMRGRCEPKNKLRIRSVFRQALLDFCLDIGRIEMAHTGACGCEGDSTGTVCGTNGQTYENQCEAASGGVEVVSQGPCPSCECEHTKVSPRCAISSQITFNNTCEAACANVENADLTEGTCQSAFQCPQKPLDWVCGDNGRTYRGPCLMEFDRINLYDCSTGCKFSDYVSQICSHIPLEE